MSDLKPCQFCREHKQGDVIQTELHQTRSIQDGIIISGRNWYIHYCPMCGRELKRDE